MIHTRRTVTIGDVESTIDKDIVLYRGDREVEVEFVIVGSKFEFTNAGNVIKSTHASHGQLVIDTPQGVKLFSEVTPCKEGSVIFVITAEMIDELEEVGLYSFQIRLFDEEQFSRISIPPVNDGIEIRSPLAAEDENNLSDTAVVDKAVVQNRNEVVGPTFDDAGDYNKTQWVKGDVISSGRLNKLEDAIYTIDNNMDEITGYVDTFRESIDTADQTLQADINRVSNRVEEVNRTLSADVADVNRNWNEVRAEMDDLSDVMSNRLYLQDERIDIFSNRMSVSVSDFGAKGDGVTDDTEAIQAAFDYVISSYSAYDTGINVAFHTVYFPKGIYKISKPINIGNRVRIVGERSIINSSAEWCIDHSAGDHGGTIGWQTEISHMIFMGQNGIRLNTRQGDATTHANLDYGHIYFHDCLFTKLSGYAFVGDVQSCLLKFDMCLLEAPLDVLCDDFVMDTCWSNWKAYNTQEFIIFKGSKMYIDKCMFIPYAGSPNVSLEKAWVGVYDYTVPSGHQGMSFAFIDRCNFGGEAACISVVNNKTAAKRVDTGQSCGVKITNSSLALSSAYAVRLFELPDQLIVEGCRGEGGTYLIQTCSDFDMKKIEYMWGLIGWITSGMRVNWSCKSNSIRLTEGTDTVRMYFGPELEPLAAVSNFKHNYMSGAKLSLFPDRKTPKRSYIVENKFKYVDDNGQLWIRLPSNIFPARHYNFTILNMKTTVREFKIKIVAINNYAGTYYSYSHNIWDYTAVVTMAEVPTNQSIRFIQDKVFKSNSQDSTNGQIIDAKVTVSYNNTTTVYPASQITGDGYGNWDYIDLALDGVDSISTIDVIIYDVTPGVHAEI